MNDRTRAFLKIQDGCDYFCSYCTVPYARGKSRNISINEVVENAKKVSLSGAKEIVLSGINLGDFGKSSGETFLDLIKELEHVEGILRYRISSIEPNLLSDEIIEYVSHSEKFVPHFHIPLQSGCNKILYLMKRRYTREIFAERINKIIGLIPSAGIGADIITGFPGESDEDLNDTCEFIKSLKLSYLHVFTFSPRPGTPAYGFNDKVSEKIKMERSNSLHEISDQLKRKFLIENDGTERNVLFESNNSKGNIFGYTENYIRVSHQFDNKLQNSILKGKLSLSGDQMTLII
jgi:threonylcarbamoyladenosine tRNA methylthiotransferase MtaB